MIQYEFKTTEDINDLQRTIVKSIPVPSVPATEQKVEFTLEQKQNELVSAEAQLVEAQKRVDDLKKEIGDVKTALNIGEVIK
jgi:septal ring factor EnvC (AmiA/AmiB activator)